ncbi:flagellar filament capping protein FliD [Dyella sp.]|uniref:flagellar filament capping protein FliD n=1 Tax=Dyella sp. TaxID=1869338 RepID=UPI002D772296|nr:flagellar filament capping protein FliD [Dyella sp.]HET7333443.1 flagellar filament capping protein FliD [Dyella sp.]
MSTISGVSSTSSALSSAISGASSPSSTGSSSGNISGTGLLSSLGLGTGLDVNAIITALVNAQEAGPQAQITNQANQDNNKIAGLTALQTALSGVQSALNELTSSTTYSTFNATLSTTALGTVSTLPDAAPGTYNLNVMQLATAQKSASAAQPALATVGTGTLNITVAGKTMNVAVGATDTLSAIATSINNSSDNPGVTATIVAGVNGNQLVLTSKSTGTANAFSVSADSTSSSGVTALASSLNTPTTAATDAKLTIDGISIDSPTNSVSGALTGVTLNLATTGTSQLTVAQSTTPISTAVNDFVSAYNTYANTVSQLQSYNSTTKVAGVLLGDATLSAVQSQIASVLGSKVSASSIGSLASLGITRNGDGTLALNATTLANTLSSNPSSVQQLFTGTNGIATRLSTLVSGFNSSSGALQSRIGNLNKDLTGLSSQQTALNARMAVYQQQLVKQYTSLSSLMSSLNNTSSYLTQAMNALTGTSNKG